MQFWAFAGEAASCCLQGMPEAQGAVCVGGPPCRNPVVCGSGPCDPAPVSPSLRPSGLHALRCPGHREGIQWHLGALWACLALLGKGWAAPSSTQTVDLSAPLGGGPHVGLGHAYVTWSQPLLGIKSFIIIDCVCGSTGAGSEYGVQAWAGDRHGGVHLCQENTGSLPAPWEPAPGGGVWELPGKGADVVGQGAPG